MLAGDATASKMALATEQKPKDRFFIERLPFSGVIGRASMRASIKIVVTCSVECKDLVEAPRHIEHRPVGRLALPRRTISTRIAMPAMKGPRHQTCSEPPSG
jgi:hypothetical protein